jgi:hypothetical protein
LNPFQLSLSEQAAPPKSSSTSSSTAANFRSSPILPSQIPDVVSSARSDNSLHLQQQQQQQQMQQEQQGSILRNFISADNFWINFRPQIF